MYRIKRLFLILCIVSFVVTIISPIQANESNVIDLQRASELALANSRAQKNVNLMADKLDAIFVIVNDGYNKMANAAHHTVLNEYLYLKQNDPTNVTRIAILEAQMDALNARSNTKEIENMAIQAEDARFAKNDAVRAVKDFEIQFPYQIEKLYTAILNQESQLSYLESSYEMQASLLNIERAKRELGLSSQHDVDKLAVQVSALGNNIASVREAIKQMKYQFNDILGRPYNATLTLVPFEVTVDHYIPRMANVQNEVLNNNAKREQLERDIQALKLRINSNAKYRDDDNERRRAEIDLKQKELELEELLVTLSTSVSNITNDLRLKQSNFELTQVAYNTTKQSYEWDKKKFELGMISRIQLETSYLTFKDTVNKKETAGYDYFLVRRALELAEQGLLAN